MSFDFWKRRERDSMTSCNRTCDWPRKREWSAVGPPITLVPRREMDNAEADQRNGDN